MLLAKFGAWLAVGEVLSGRVVGGEFFVDRGPALLAAVKRSGLDRFAVVRAVFVAASTDFGRRTRVWDSLGAPEMLEGLFAGLTVAELPDP